MSLLAQEASEAAIGSLEVLERLEMDHKAFVVVVASLVVSLLPYAPSLFSQILRRLQVTWTAVAIAVGSFMRLLILVLGIPDAESMQYRRPWLP